MDHDEVRDDELVRRHRNGDVSAFPILVKRHGSGLYAYTRSLVRDRNVADDVYQDTLLKAWRAVAPDGTYQTKGNFCGWLFRIAYRTALDYLRRSPVQQLAGTIPSGVLSPEDVALAKETRSIIMRCVEECLDPVERSVLILRCCEGMKVEEVAEIHDIAIGTVSKWVQRALAKLREHLQQRGIDV